jgi:flagellar hook-associated protein 3 FlgL
MISRTLLSDLSSVMQRLNKAQEQLASGKSLSKPSDDPFAVSQALRLRSELAQNQQYQRNTQEASSWQSVTDNALGSIGDYVQRARTLVIQGANGSTDPTSRVAIADEIDQIIEGIKSTANSQYAGQYVFSGAQTGTAPYASGASDAYSGDPKTLAREIGPGVSVELNVTGSSVVGDDSSGLLKALRDISTDLRSNNTDALGNADLQAIDVAQDNVSQIRSVVGARSNRLDSAVSRLQATEDLTNKLLSNTEDVDMAKASIDYSTQQAVYSAALKVGAQIVQPSLVDFLTTG